MLGCFNWPDVACNWRSFTDRINTVVTAGMKCIQAKPNGRCCAAIAVSVTTANRPCIIVAIRRDDSILLAQHTRHRNGVHTVLAGFVEVGETLEQAVAREVMEESGIKVKNLRYVTSQPWPFPQSLMTAFMAEYDSGEIVIDPKELLEGELVSL